MRGNETDEERKARSEREHEAWMKAKGIGAIKVGNDRYFWIAYRFGVWISGRSDYADGNGFAATPDEAMAAARQFADTIPGPLKESPKGYQGTIRRYYQKHHARKPKPSAETGARPELGSLWESACRWDSGWIKWTITKITPKRVFVYKHREITTVDGISSVLTFANDTQRSFDRATLEKDGRAFYKNGTGSSFFYTDAGKAKEEADLQTRESPPCSRCSACHGQRRGPKC